MKQKNHSVEEIIRILRQADMGQAVSEVCRMHNISEASFYRWKKKYEISCQALQGLLERLGRYCCTHLFYYLPLTRSVDMFLSEAGFP